MQNVKSVVKIINNMEAASMLSYPSCLLLFRTDFGIAGVLIFKMFLINLNI